MSIRLLGGWQAQINKDQGPTIHTAIDDLESFLWLLVWVIVHILKDNTRARNCNPGIKMALQAWTGDLTSQVVKDPWVEGFWRDDVFGGLIEEWMAIFKKARKWLKDEDLSRVTDSQAGPHEEVWDRLEGYCMAVYEGVLESGFRHLEGVSIYTNWDEVVNAM
jgi:hypothetical protein